MTEPFAKLRMALFCYGIAYFILLCHGGLKHTEKYTRAVDSLKREAITPCLLFFDGGTKLNAHS